MKVSCINILFTIFLDALPGSTGAKIRFVTTDKQFEDTNGSGIVRADDSSIVWGRTLSETEKVKRRLKGVKSTNAASDTCGGDCATDDDCGDKCTRCKGAKGKKGGKCTDKGEKGKGDLFAKDKEGEKSYSYGG